ncbi:TusE/DsrC/DsvC family sulfur relay protein [Chloroflexota bacterium]
MREQRKPGGATIELDEDGFLKYPEMWTKEVARSLTRGEVPNILTPDHLKIINCVRQYYLESGTIPPIRLVIRSTGFSLACIHELFPSGYLKDICKVAGIPRNTVRIAPMLYTHHE